MQSCLSDSAPSEYDYLHRWVSLVSHPLPHGFRPAIYRAQKSICLLSFLSFLPIESLRVKRWSQIFILDFIPNDRLFRAILANSCKASLHREIESEELLRSICKTRATCICRSCEPSSPHKAHWWWPCLQNDHFPLNPANYVVYMSVIVEKARPSIITDARCDSTVLVGVGTYQVFSPRKSTAFRPCLKWAEQS